MCSALEVSLENEGLAALDFVGLHPSGLSPPFPRERASGVKGARPGRVSTAFPMATACFCSKMVARALSHCVLEAPAVFNRKVDVGGAGGLGECQGWT